jgi:hypothetical protein
MNDRVHKDWSAGHVDLRSPTTAALFVGLIVSAFLSRPAPPPRKPRTTKRGTR